MPPDVVLVQLLNYSFSIYSGYRYLAAVVVEAARSVCSTLLSTLGSNGGWFSRFHGNLPPFLLSINIITQIPVIRTP